MSEPSKNRRVTIHLQIRQAVARVRTVIRLGPPAVPSATHLDSPRSCGSSIYGARIQFRPCNQGKCHRARLHETRRSLRSKTLTPGLNWATAWRKAG